MSFVSYKYSQYFCKVETFIAVVAIILGLVGIVGSIAPGLPGPPLSWVGLLLIYLWGGDTDGGGDPMTLRFLLVWLVVTIVITIVDYIVPAYFTKLTGGSKAGGWGSIIGLFVGLVYPPVGMILGALAGAFIAELVFAKKDTATSLKSALGAFLGFIFGTGAKLVASGIMLFYIFVFAF